MQLVRLASGILIARLVTPDLLGVMVIVYTLRYGTELLSDIGIGQSIVTNKNADDERFYNTAWSLQVIRGLFLALVFITVTVRFGRIYDSEVLNSALPIISFYFILAGFNSMSIFIVVRRMQITRLNLFDFFVETVSAVARVALAYVSPTIGGLISGSFAHPVIRLVGSYFLVSGVRHKFFLSKDYSSEIFEFGKWIFLSAVLFFLSSNFDRLYLGKVIPLAFLGIFGIARNYSGIVGDGIGRLCRVVVFPLIASTKENSREQTRQQLASARWGFMLLVAAGLALFVTVSDFLVAALYDRRYHEAGWMLALLSIGLWFTILSNVNEWTLVGIGKTKYSALSNGVKLAWIGVALPIAAIQYGMLGAIAVVAFSDFFRYMPVLIGQLRNRISFVVQDFISTLVFLVLILLFECIRFSFSLGTSLSQVPFPHPA